MTWTYVRIEPSKEPGLAALFLMSESRQRLVENVIACLPIFGAPSKVSVLADEDWRYMLDVLADINDRCGRGESVMVETSDGETWEYRPTELTDGAR
jgi:hypothetical protein